MSEFYFVRPAGKTIIYTENLESVTDRIGAIRACASKFDGWVEIRREAPIFSFDLDEDQELCPT